MQFTRAWPLWVLTLLLAAPAAHAKAPADHFKGKIILSTKPFPTSFKNDAAFIKHMKRADTRGFKYGEKDTMNIEFMAFFARPYTSTGYTVTIYDVTQGRTSVATFPIYPDQKSTRILASGMTLDLATFQEEKAYLMVVTATYGGPIIAEANFSIKAGPDGPREPAAVK